MGFQATMRFAVMSDLHYSDKHLYVRDRFRAAMQMIYKYCSQETYQKLDALYINGDFTDLGARIDMERLKEDCDRYVAPETKVVLTLANHELHYVEDYRVPMQDFQEIFQMPQDRHEVIGGYHFISLSGTIDAGPWHDSYDAKKRTFLKEALQAARRDGGNRPIFVFQHVGIPGTIPGGVWGNRDLYTILADYPQVIDFSGHSHQAVNDPKEIAQGAFTCVSSGSLYDIHARTNHMNPDETYEAALDKECAHMLLVEADAQETVRIRRIDILAGDFFENDSYIKKATPAEHFTYTAQRAAKVAIPYFTDAAKASAVRENGCISLSFTAAKCDGERVAGYRICFYDANGVALAQKLLVSDYHHLKQAEEVSRSLPDVADAEEVQIYATGFWDNVSQPYKVKIENRF